MNKCKIKWNVNLPSGTTEEETILVYELYCESGDKYITTIPLDWIFCIGKITFITINGKYQENDTLLYHFTVVLIKYLVSYIIYH